MDINEFRKRGHELVDWMADYFENIEQYPVKSGVAPKDIIRQLPESPPEKGESFNVIFNDFQEIIIPGMTHWQHPSYFAYFNANNSYPSVLAEMLTATMGAQCMIWQTSPAAAELEERVMQWTAELIGLPKEWDGVIQETASAATLVSLLSAREKYSDYEVNRGGFYNRQKFTVYCSTETHSSIEKAVKIIGLGKENLRKIEVGDEFAMIPERLEEAVIRDREQGFIPLAVVATFGTTGSTAIDPLEPIADICREYNIWLHVDAAYAGTALVLPEKRHLIKGIEKVDTFVFNPHKWMFTNFDCSAYFVKDKEPLIRSLEILPEYLKTKEGSRVNNYRDWGIQLGRRFRALKLWFVIRTFGASGIREKVRNHIQWAQELVQEIEASEDFELLAPVPFATICFRYKPKGVSDRDELNRLNQQLMETLNDSGKMYLTHTKLKGIYTLRLVIGQTNQEKRHVDQAWKRIKATAANLSG
ncbi:MAG: aspartate aminotransferase family protein [Candidatus Aminicenantes bacterium]|nr:aspartate aminotransferase family protein [Candidatus Aminicenantes bacterium]NIM77241.1 aspartate aminotransferase family protein [Candidatus Aminicenantes bacterium]NIN16542.1 aspartate aminotransferase family protein [Candidatus Aminicenantes bacterium]NIN40400.1 aspartate aminotransferase family protein [Candidatus Aminicenantes bacterium]NIN83220.1 aspartate aminotransferase family protein [Candidatus Aminicenantes bacterium]